jgi:thioredoxin reductase/CRP-like cAMP-binding protein/Fe-S-cluster-containing hydrogenase component 2
MSELHQIAIVGAGPAGLSAAARAAEAGLSHILLEAAPHIAATVFQYQKTKYVMDEPAPLPLRGSIPFTAGSREEVLAAWDAHSKKLAVNLRCNSEVSAIEGKKGEFTLRLKSGESVRAAQVILCVGMQGNLRKLDIPGEDLPLAQYQLDDPAAYSNETIVVVGAGDSAIENALALARQNHVIIINRRDEFIRAKQANLNAILQAVKTETVECLYSTQPAVIHYNPEADKAGLIEIKTPAGPTEIPCNRVIARLGATPPRRFLESCGIAFPSTDPAAVPALSQSYESNVPGLYIIGSLAGYPLIKQAINQGYEVIEFIRGNAIAPADEPLLREKFRNLPVFHSVTESLRLIQRNVPLLAGLTTLQLREFLLDSEIRTPKPGEMIFKYNDYTNTFFSIVSGEVQVLINRNDPTQVITLRQGQFFGEMGLISGRRRTASVLAGAGKQCVLIETPRRSMNRLINSVASVKHTIDKVFMLRAIQSHIAPEIPASDLAAVVQSAKIQHFMPGEVLFHEGDPADCLHLIRLGSVTVSRNIGGEEMILSYLSAGNYIGENALLSDTPRAQTVRAAVATETIRLEVDTFKTLLSRSKTLRHQIEAKFQERQAQNALMEAQPQAGNVISFLVAQGLGEATDVILIDESLCVRCDNCEKACAETHGGTSRLDRDAGPTFASIHVPTSCRHCEHPHCMKDCPPDAIHRAPNGEVYIADNCIGCGNCQRNCPYGVIQMASPQKRKPWLVSWLLLGRGPGPGKTDPSYILEGEKKAVKCDMCHNQPGGGPACVSACPTGAAMRVSPEEFMSLAAKW